MARIRSMKPEFRTSLTVTSWPRDVRLFFSLLWGYCDDHGRGVDEPRLIKADCFPLDDDITSSTINEWLDLIAKTETVVRYTVGGKRFLAIPEWGQHQRPQHPRPSQFPPVEHADPVGNPSAIPSIDRSDHPEELTEFLMRDSGENHDAVTQEGLGSRRGSGEVEEENLSSEAADATPDGEDPGNPEPVMPVGPFKAGPGGKNDRADVAYLCDLLAHLMVGNECKPPTINKTWLDDARLMLDKDRRDFTKAAALIRWCQKDKFWKANIQSMPTFRAQYDQLRLKALAEWEKAKEDGWSPRQAPRHVDKGNPTTVPELDDDPFKAALGEIGDGGDGA